MYVKQRTHFVMYLKKNSQLIYECVIRFLKACGPLPQALGKRFFLFKIRVICFSTYILRMKHIFKIISFGLSFFICTPFFCAGHVIITFISYVTWGNPISMYRLRRVHFRPLPLWWPLGTMDLLFNKLFTFYRGFLFLNSYVNIRSFTFFSGSDLPSCSNVTSGTSLIECPQEDWTVPTVAAMYMLFSNILLVSLVIAMFR